MGRNKIEIEPIREEKLRNITFNKRKHGLLKKATELSILCNIKVVLIFTDLNNNLCKLSSPSEDEIDIKHLSNNFKKIQEYGPENYPSFKMKRRKERCDKNKPRMDKPFRRMSQAHLQLTS